MTHATVIDFSRILLARLMPGESVAAGFRGILDTHRIQRGVILSGIGSLMEAEFLGVKPGAVRPFGLKCITRLEAHGPFEILTIAGNIFPSSRRQIILFMSLWECLMARSSADIW